MEVYTETITPKLNNGIIEVSLTISAFNELKYGYERYIQQKEKARECMQKKRKETDDENGKPKKERMAPSHKNAVKLIIKSVPNVTL